MNLEEFKKKLAQKKKELQKRQDDYNVERDGIHTRRL